MGRSVGYLNNSERVNYFQWPTVWVYDEDTNTDVETDEFWDADEVVDDITSSIIERFPEFSVCRKRWDGNETRIILEGYGTEIGLSEYCGLATLSIRVDQSILEYMGDDADFWNDTYVQWIADNWNEIGKYWNQYRKIGTFSNGEGVYEKAN
jgi:hypothetical protein